MYSSFLMIKMKVICLIFIFLGIYIHLSHELSPKSALKHGVKTFLEQVTKPSEGNFCFEVSIGVFEELLNDFNDVDAAFDRGFKKDFTSTKLKGRCKKAFGSFEKNLESLKEKKVNKVYMYFYSNFEERNGFKYGTFSLLDYAPS